MDECEVNFAVCRVDVQIFWVHVSLRSHLTTGFLLADKSPALEMTNFEVRTKASIWCLQRLSASDIGKCRLKSGKLIHPTS